MRAVDAAQPSYELLKAHDTFLSIRTIESGVWIEDHMHLRHHKGIRFECPGPHGPGQLGSWQFGFPHFAQFCWGASVGCRRAFRQALDSPLLRLS